jgi:sugar/nucleoside kinase (ribokinase family)
MSSKKYDVVGLGACGIDHIAKVKSFADKGKKVTSHDVEMQEGGVTANNLVQAARLGLESAWCGVLGEDEHGEHLLTVFDKDNVDVAVERSGKTQGCWIAVDDDGERQIYVFPNASSCLSVSMVEGFRDVLEDCTHFHTEIAVIPLAAALKGAAIAKKAGAKVFVDVDGDVEHLIKQGKIGTMDDVHDLIGMADVLKLSEGAAKQIMELKKVDAILDELLETADVVVLTLGGEGCIMADSHSRVRCGSPDVACVDGTGAGDAFMGGLSYALLKGLGLKQAGMFANACGAYCCTQKGARGSGTLQDVKGLL